MLALLKYAKPGKRYVVRAILGQDKLTNVGLVEGSKIYLIKNLRNDLVFQHGNKRKAVSKKGTERVILSSIRR